MGKIINQENAAKVKKYWDNKYGCDAEVTVEEGTIRVQYQLSTTLDVFNMSNRLYPYDVKRILEKIDG